MGAGKGKLARPLSLACAQQLPQREVQHCASNDGEGKDADPISLSLKTEQLNIKGNITMGKEAKTNAMRILEREKVPYTAHEYAHEEGVAVGGVTVAASMGEDPACVYKTLVTQGASKNYFVFVIPVAAELDLKAAARSVGEKSVAMIHVADINKVTGYVRGGCSPVGMKKQYKTVFDESVLTQQKVYVSGGRIGTQVCCAPADLIRAARAATAKIIF